MAVFETINTFEVPERGAEFYYLKEVPHGTVHLAKYASGVNGHLKEVMYTRLMEARKIPAGGIRSYIYSMVSVKMRRDGSGRGS